MTASLSRLVEAELAKRWHAQAAAPLRELYEARREDSRRVDTRYTMWAAVAIYVAFSPLDFVLIPDVGAWTTLARLLFGGLAILLIEGLTRLDARADVLDAVGAGIVVACYIAWLAIAVFSSHALSASYYMVFGTIFMMVASLFFNFRPLSSILASVAILSAFFAATIFVAPVTPAYRLAFGTFYLCCFGFTGLVNWKLNAERYNVFLNALQAELRQEEVDARSRDLLRLSNTDPLTGLDNRRAIDEKLRRLWADWQDTGRGFATVLIDIDFFKKYNDFHGHQAGDRCLVVVGHALAAALKPFDASIGRYGGEEFIVIARLKRADEVACLAETIRGTVEALGLPHGHRRDGTSVVTVSVGAAVTRPQIGPKLEKLINEADRALYGAKANGRNCVRLFDPNDPQSSDESENIAALLRIAVAQNLVSLVYQPIQNVATGEVEAVEALMRLRMLDGTNVPPSLFIPIAERTGAILELGRWAIRTACREILASHPGLVVSVNVSAVQLRAPGFPASVAAILGEAGVTGNRLALEITEGLELEMHSDVLRCISELKQLGIRIWLDDFGTGFAGLSWLRLISFDTVKIDRSFLHDSADPRGAAMLQDIIALIRNRGHRMLVEGVETAEQMALMRAYRIDQIQGYHVGRPMPADSIKADLRTRRVRA
ncbi:putative bifunctional diguanylate cyclase/phosphodiesterase [Antarcticirhabdus aurantiaca]|uniref:GGDEF and EAL domain-containing protein n=1 Tax=Antarcticirhabdus aurantiaca TaxID=2606717 RepID=A0ACD4NNP8_9HYPH|nr:EAL domain-containing protein [Antarcticirhabdus aurantiaca]WAJ28521.1 GGDEF and EAL domain-containing protein [Jeongeuplla avenae]